MSAGAFVGLSARCRAGSCSGKSTTAPEILRPESGFKHVLKTICQAIVTLVKQAWLLPQCVQTAIRQKRRQLVLSKLEAERLDRIRNPSKYLGK